MTSTLVRIKRSEVAGNPSILGAGELAYSALTDNGSNGGDRLYIGMGAETNGNAVSHVVIGGKYFVDQINAATAINTAGTIVRRNASGDFAANIITATLNGVAASANKWATARTLNISGDGTGSFVNVDGSTDRNATFTLATVNANNGTFGSATQVPVFTVNEKGLITAVSTATISTNLSIGDGTTTDAVSLLSDTLLFAGGNGLVATVTNNTVTYALPQALGTTSNVTFNNVSVNGSLNSDDITAANININGNASIAGNLTVLGTTTTVNSTTVSVADINITLAKDAADAVQADGAGLTVAGANATITYSSGNDRWNLNKDLVVSNVYGALKGNADSATVAAAWATARNLSLTGDGTATLSSVDGSANVSAAFTLATVNSTTGSFGDSVTVPTVTVNAKGLVTQVTQTAIPTATALIKGLANFASANFTVTSGLVEITAVDGGTY